MILIEITKDWSSFRHYIGKHDSKNDLLKTKPAQLIELQVEIKKQKLLDKPELVGEKVLVFIIIMKFGQNLIFI